jgi:hypothetical protein
MRAHHLGADLGITTATRSDQRAVAGLTRSVMHRHRDRHQPGRYEIRVEGHLDARWIPWFDGLSLRRDSDGTTIIGGLVADQAALHGLLSKVRDTGLPLLSVTPVDLEPPSA